MEKNQEILVSIAMITYNHEKFIAQAIESILSQKVNFRYEIIIGEDCSKDKTRDICKKYKNLYPDKIKLILQPNNVGMLENSRRVFEACTGKYIAHLEGDDYWNDDKKLQRQIDFLEKHNEYIACVHNSYILNYEDNRKKKLSKKRKNYSLKIEDIIEWNNLFQTSSLVIKGNLYLNRPQFADGLTDAGDYSMALWLALNGKIYYMANVMSTYRFQTPGSWTQNNIIEEKIKKNQEKIKNMLNSFDQYTNYKYSQYVNKRIERIAIDDLYRNGKFEEIEKYGYKKLFNICDIPLVSSIFLRLHLNKLYCIIKKFR